MIKFSNDTPDWVKDWLKWAADLLVPDWVVSVKMVNNFQDDEACGDNFWNKDDLDMIDQDRVGQVSVRSENLCADIQLLHKIEDDHEGHVAVVHEMCHAFTAHMSEAAKNLISNKVVKKTAWKSFDGAEEQAVVRLSRTLVALREQFVLNFVASND
jgi:hypothetical protein